MFETWQGKEWVRVQNHWEEVVWYKGRPYYDDGGHWHLIAQPVNPLQAAPTSAAQPQQQQQPPQGHPHTASAAEQPLPQGPVQHQQQQPQQHSQPRTPGQQPRQVGPQPQAQPQAQTRGVQFPTSGRSVTRLKPGCTWHRSHGPSRERRVTRKALGHLQQFAGQVAGWATNVDADHRTNNAFRVQTHLDLQAVRGNIAGTADRLQDTVTRMDKLVSDRVEMEVQRRMEAGSTAPVVLSSHRLGSFLNARVCAQLIFTSDQMRCTSAIGALDKRRVQFESAFCNPPPG